MGGSLINNRSWPTRYTELSEPMLAAYKKKTGAHATTFAVQSHDAAVVAIESIVRATQPGCGPDPGPDRVLSVDIITPSDLVSHNHNAVTGDPVRRFRRSRPEPPLAPAAGSFTARRSDPGPLAHWRLHSPRRGPRGGSGHLVAQQLTQMTRRLRRR